MVLPRRISVAVTPGVSAARIIAGAAGTRLAAPIVVIKVRLRSMNLTSREAAL
jgi:hypothetical protein